MQTVDNLFDLQNYKHKNTKTQENRGEKKTKKKKKPETSQKLNC